MAYPYILVSSEKLSWFGLLYRRFVKDFSCIVAPMTEVLMGKNFVWTEKANSAFEEIKARLCQAPMLALPNLIKSLR